MAIDLVLRDARIAGREESVVDIAIADGRIVEIAAAIATDAAEQNVGGRLVVPGFVESHIASTSTSTCISISISTRRGWTSTKSAARNLDDYGIAVGHPADLVVLDCRDRASAVAELAAPLFGFKRGRRSFTRPPVALHLPNS